MTKKELAEIKRRFTLDHNNITCIRGCYVNSQGEVISAFSRSLVGMPQEEIERLNERFRNKAPQQAQHIGLQNVNQRIRLIYGQQSGLFLSQCPEGGLCIEVRYAE